MIPPTLVTSVIDIVDMQVYIQDFIVILLVYFGKQFSLPHAFLNVFIPLSLNVIIFFVVVVSSFYFRRILDIGELEKTR